MYLGKVGHCVASKFKDLTALGALEDAFLVVVHAVFV